MSEAAAQGAEALELTYERVFDAPRAKVFDAWTNPTILARWWGPKSHTIPKVDLDLKEGGRWSTVMRGPDGSEITVSGTYKKIEPPRRLSFTWGWMNDGQRGHETTVEVEFEEQGSQTLMRFRQGTFESANAAEMHDQGWTSTWEAFDEFLSGGGLT